MFRLLSCSSLECGRTVFFGVTFREERIFSLVFFAKDRLSHVILIDLIPAKVLDLAINIFKFGMIKNTAMWMIAVSAIVPGRVYFAGINTKYNIAHYQEPFF